MYELKTCFKVELLSDFSHQIEIIANYYNVTTVEVKILDESVFILKYMQFLKKINVPINDLNKLYVEDFVCLVTDKDTKPEDIEDSDLLCWINFVEDTKITSPNQEDFILYHCYAQDLLFLLSKKAIPLEQLEWEPLNKEEFNYIINEQPDYSNRRFQHVQELLEGEEVDSFFNTTA